MQLDGPVHFTIKSQRLIEEGTPPKKSMAPYTINGQCQELAYDDTGRKLVLNGNVKVNSDDPVYPIQSSARKVTIVLDEEGNPIEIHGEGEPGVTEARQRPPKRK